MMSARGLLFLGFGLVLLGVVIPFLMVMNLLPAGFLLAFLSYASSIAGLLLGMIGAAQLVMRR